MRFLCYDFANNERTRRVSKYNFFSLFSGSAACACNAFDSGFVYIKLNTWSRTPSPACIVRSIGGTICFPSAFTNGDRRWETRTAQREIKKRFVFSAKPARVRPAAFDQRAKQRIEREEQILTHTESRAMHAYKTFLKC